MNQPLVNYLTNLRGKFKLGILSNAGDATRAPEGGSRRLILDEAARLLREFLDAFDDLPAHRQAGRRLYACRPCTAGRRHALRR